MTPQIEKSETEKEAMDKLTFAIGQLTNVLVSLHDQLQKLVKIQAARDAP
jgi:hypothetical protein